MLVAGGFQRVKILVHKLISTEKKTQPSASKATAFWDSYEPIYVDFLTESECANKTRSLLSKGVNVLHDIARQHTA